MPIATGTAIAIGALTSAGATAYGAHRASSSNNRAAEVQAQSSREALAFERQQEETRRAEWEREQNELRQQWDTKEANAQPYRMAAAGVLRSRFSGGQAPGLAGLLGPRPFQQKPYQPGRLSDLAR